jgi:formylglycine-generating enzyme required for sulfatase activity
MNLSLKLNLQKHLTETNKRELAVRKIIFVGLMVCVGSAWAFKDCPECPEMVEIPSGSFLMGNSALTSRETNNEKPRHNNEKPQHQVKVSGFAMGKYLVTQAQWFAFMGNNPSKNKGDLLPVDNISWDDAQMFASMLSQKTGQKYRLPSEAEWEYAAKAGTSTDYFWGDDEKIAIDYAWYVNNSGGKTQPVGLKKPNQWGLHDMVGNVYQWAEDCWNVEYVSAPNDGTAWTTGDCSLRVLRGGSWNVHYQFLRTTTRYFVESEFPYSFSGLRVVRD